MSISKREVFTAVLVLAASATAAIVLPPLLGQVADTSDAVKRIEMQLAASPLALARARGAVAQRQWALEQIAQPYEIVLATQSPRWLGAVAMQSPDDAWTIQEILVETKPDIIIEAGTYRGGMALFMASVLSLINPAGKVITLDVSPEGAIDRQAREHRLWSQYVEFIQGDDTAPAIIARLKERTANKKTLVLLDTLHTLAHTRKELPLYADLVSVGSYLIMHDTNYSGHPLGPPDGMGPYEAVQEFLKHDHRFVADRSRERFIITLMPSGFLKRVK